MNTDLKGFQNHEYILNNNMYNSNNNSKKVYTCNTYETETLLNKNLSINVLYNENTLLKKKVESLQIKLEASNNKYTNLKRNKLRLKNLLNIKLTEKEDEINLVCEKHYFEINKLVEEHENKIKELNERYVRNNGWEWETIEDLDNKNESEK